jgi:hypothetical protein
MITSVSDLDIVMLLLKIFIATGPNEHVLSEWTLVSVPYLLHVHLYFTLHQ